MKDFLRKILSKLKLLEAAKKAARILRPSDFDKRYGTVKEYHLKKDEIDIVYSTVDRYSKKWFFPRYDNGRLHEPVTTQLFIEQINESDCVFDIGAHLGYFTCLAGILAPKGEVHAFEADKKCVPLIRTNLHINKLENAVINNNAVTSHNRTEKIPFRETPRPGLTINSSDPDAIVVKALTIDEYVKNIGRTPDLVKIDVEGAEWNVLNGMKHILAKKDLKMLIEVHVEKLRRVFDTDYKLILSYLDEQGFAMEEVVSHRESQSDFRRIYRDSELEANTMLFCYKTNR